MGYPIQRFWQNNATSLRYILKRVHSGKIAFVTCVRDEIATHIRVDAPLWSNTLFPVYIAVLMWGGLWLRNELVRKLFVSAGKQRSGSM